MPERRPDADRDDRERNRVTSDDVGTAASANVAGRVPEGTEPSKGISAAGGAVGGAAAGTTAGMVTLGPIGAIVGAIAGAVGGGWLGLASGREDAERSWSDEHEAEYRRHYEHDPERLADRSFDDTRVAYQLGHFAAANPDYSGRRFDEIEPELRHGWTPEVQAAHGSWETARRYARAAYETRQGHALGQGFVDVEMGGTETHRRASFADPIAPGDPDGVSGQRPLLEDRE